MRKTFLIFAACFMAIVASAQILETVSMQQITFPDGKDGKIVGISPKGNFLLLTNLDEKGLISYDLATKSTTTISDEGGVAWGVQISKDASKITYRKRNWEGDARIVKFDIMQYNINDRKATMSAKAQSGTEKLVDATANVTASISTDLELVLTRNGKRIVLNPNNTDKAYSWASVSPDGTKILYYVATQGCYVCDLNGQNAQFVARHCRAAQWYDNNTIIGMADEDDGHKFTASAIVAYTLDGKSQILVNKDMVAMYPYVAPGKVAFTTDSGKMYLMTVK